MSGFSISGFSISGFSMSGFSMSGLSTVRPARPPATVVPPTAPSSLTSTVICARGSVEVAYTVRDAVERGGTRTSTKVTGAGEAAV